MLAKDQEIERHARFFNFQGFYLVTALLLGTFVSTHTLALDPPSNIRIEDGDLLWDPVPDVNEYLIYYFNGPIPSPSVLGNFLVNTGGTRWPLDTFDAPFGYYTVVSIQTNGGPAPVEFSAVTDGDIVPFLDTGSATTSIPPVTLPGSGQQQSFFPGDDGDLQAGVQTTTERYVLNGDGTFTDTLTNLVWVADSACIPLLDWTGSLEHATGLSADGSSTCTSLQDGSLLGDWRLANIVELLSLFNYSLNAAIGDVPLTNLGSVITDDFWSSTSFESAPTPNDIGLAWQLKFLSDPDVGSHVDQKFNLGRAWAVRSR